MATAVDGDLSRTAALLLTVALAVPPLAVTWHGIAGATASDQLLLGATVIPLGALAVGLGTIATRIREREAVGATERN